MLERTKAPVGPSHAQRFASDGVLVVEDLVGADETARLRERLERRCQSNATLSLIAEETALSD